MKKPDDGKKKMAPGKGRKAAAPVNPRLGAQTRKVMGKHYAAKYGVSKRKG